MTTIRLPLLADRHSHPLFYAACLDGLNIRDFADKSGAMTAIAQHAERLAGELLIVQGWIDSKFDLTGEDLDGLPPVAVFNLSLHGMVRNAEADRLLRARYGDFVDRWTDQEWYERNFRSVLNCFANLNASVERLQAFYRWLEQEHGVGYAEELLLVDAGEIALFREAGLLDRTAFWAAPDTFASLSEQDRQAVRGVKLFTDGALGVRTAALHEPYDDGQCGMLLYSDEALYEILKRSFAMCAAVAIHAIGDRAIDQTIAALETHGRPSHCEEIRIEHAQLIAPTTARRAKDLGVILSMQPNFSADSRDYRDRLGPRYLRGNNPFRMLIDEAGFRPGEDLVFGSDGMPHGVGEALEQSLFPPHPDTQRLTVEEFIAGYCSVRRGPEQLEATVEGQRVRWSRLS